MFAYAAARRLSEVELLRFKPAGRGARAYDELRCTDAQHRLFLPTILAAARRHRVRVKVDCSYTPMLAHHRPDRALLAELARLRLHRRRFPDRREARRPDHRVQLRRAAADRDRQATGRHRARELLASARTRSARFAPGATRGEPCASCEYHALCRGGCKVVSAHVPAIPRHRIPSALVL